MSIFTEDMKYFVVSLSCFSLFVMAACERTKPGEKFFKICLTGQKNVGKTSIFNAIRGKPFTKNPKAEINYYSHVVNVDGENVKVRSNFHLF